MSDTAQIRSALVTALADNTSGAITPQVLRNLLASISVVGAWSSSVTYGVNDIVLETGIYYICTASHTNHVPPNGTYWSPLAAFTTTAPLNLSNGVLSISAATDSAAGSMSGADKAWVDGAQNGTSNASFGTLTVPEIQIGSVGTQIGSVGTIAYSGVVSPQSANLGLANLILGRNNTLYSFNNILDDGSGNQEIAGNLNVSGGTITIQEGSQIGGAGGGMQFVSTNGRYMEWDTYNSGMLELNGGLTTVLNTLDDGSGNTTISGQLNLNGNMTVNGTTGLSIPNGSVAVGGNTVLSPSRGYCGSPVIGQYGGTGVNNGSKTITLGGNLTTSGATIIGSSTNTVTIATTGNTSVTLPTSGTLLTTAGSGSSLTFGTGSLSLAGSLTTSGAFATTLTVTGTTNLTLPITGTLVTTTGTVANITATSNSTITTLSSLSLPAAQITGPGSSSILSLSASSNLVAVNAASVSLLTPIASITLTSSSWTISNPTNGYDGQKILFRLVQDGTGSRTISWGTAYDFGSSGTPTLSTAANAIDLVVCYYYSAGTKWLCQFAGGF